MARIWPWQGQIKFLKFSMRKGAEQARKDMQLVSLTAVSIPHDITGKFKLVALCLSLLPTAPALLLAERSKRCLKLQASAA